MRTNLVLHFHCSECGSLLDIKTENEEDVKNERVSYNHENPLLPTGATLRCVDPIQIIPCERCIEKYNGPAKKLLEAFKEINDIS